MGVPFLTFLCAGILESLLSVSSSRGRFVIGFGAGEPLTNSEDTTLVVPALSCRAFLVGANLAAKFVGFFDNERFAWVSSSLTFLVLVVSG
jgi:hypothetical protein